MVARGGKIHSEVSPGSRETVLALRLFALAVGCACGCLVESVVASPGPFIQVILAGAVLALAQYRLPRITPRRAAAALLLPHIALWTVLVLISGGARSPLIVGYLFEVPLAGVLLGRAGVLSAAAAAAVAMAIVSRVGGAAVPWAWVAAEIGFIGVACVLSSWLIGVVEQQRAEIATSHEQLRRRADTTADELRMLGDFMSGGLVTIDDLGRVVSVNPAGASLLRTSQAAAKGLAWQEVLRPEGAGCAELARGLTDARGARALRLLLTPSGERPIAVVADVWTRESREGARSYVLLDAAVESADGDPLRRLGEAAASVSHQIKNSLHALQGFAREIAPESGGAPTDRIAADQLDHALGTLGELAEDVLAMSGAPRAEETVALQPIVASAVLLTRRSDVQVVVRNGVCPDVCVRVHRGRLVHALFNLIDNACRATAPGSSVEVSLGTCEQFAWVDICDRGPGIREVPTPWALPNPTLAPQPRGNGLGLVATRRFLDSFGARLEFLPRDGGGSRCRVHLARAHALVDGERELV